MSNANITAAPGAETKELDLTIVEIEDATTLAPDEGGQAPGMSHCGGCGHCHCGGCGGCGCGGCGGCGGCRCGGCGGCRCGGCRCA